MTTEEAINTAIAYETRIRDLYQEAADTSEDAAGKNLFQTLANDEQRHIDYLESRLKQWTETGKITLEALTTTLPSRAALSEEMAKLEAGMARDDREIEQQMLTKALQVEQETSDFYQKMVDAMTDEAGEMFARFLQIENEHIDIVQAELDFVMRTGYWFDIKEFDMEGYA